MSRYDHVTGSLHCCEDECSAVVDNTDLLVAASQVSAVLSC